MSIFPYSRFLLISILSLLLFGCASKNPHSNEIGNLPEEAVITRASDLNIQLGMAYLREGRLDLAKLKFMRALELEPTSAKALYSLGYYYEKTQDVPEATAAYQKAFALAPNDPNVQNSYGVFLCRTGQYDQGEALLVKAASQNTFEQVGLAYENAGFCMAKAGQSDQAIAYFKKAIDHNPRLVNSYYELANINFNSGHYKEASYYFKQFEAHANQTTESLEFGIKLAEHFQQEEEVADLKARLDQNKMEIE